MARVVVQGKEIVRFWKSGAERWQLNYNNTKKRSQHFAVTAYLLYCFV